MNDAKPSASFVTTKVYNSVGAEAGTIEELLVDPFSGIVRFASIRRADNVSIVVPWAVMLYIKSKLGFMLTPKGELMVQGPRLH